MLFRSQEIDTYKNQKYTADDAKCYCIIAEHFKKLRKEIAADDKKNIREKNAGNKRHSAF